MVFDSSKAVEVVGVARDVRSLNPRQSAGFIVYEPQSQHHPVTAIEIRASVDPHLLAAPVRRILGDSYGLRGAEVRPLWDALRSGVGQDRLLAALSAAFGLLALTLASVGLYGVVAYTVERRAQEIGIRVALGATRAEIAAFFLRQAGGLILGGIAIGLAAALVAVRFLRGLLFGIVPYDPAMLASAALLLAVVAVSAALVPSCRAARLDPTQALRRE